MANGNPFPKLKRLVREGKHFCIIPWMHLYVTGLGYMGSCCGEKKGPYTRGHGNLNTQSFAELWQGESIRRFRLAMLRDAPSPQCEVCYEQERRGEESLRLLHNRRYGEKYLDWLLTTDREGFALDAKPVYWDIRFSNRCNLRCRSCSYTSSSAWFADAKALSPLTPKKKGSAVIKMANARRLLDELEPYFPVLEKVMFAGGEPLLIEENDVILKKLNEMKKYDTEVHYITNLTVVRRAALNLERLWKNFRSLYLTVSLDGSGRRGEYLRKGLDWEKALTNLAYLQRQFPGAKLRVNYTVSAFNVLHAPDFHREMTEGERFPADALTLSFLHDPVYYSMKILPGAMKKRAVEKIDRHIEWLRGLPAFAENGASETAAACITQWEHCRTYLYDGDLSHLIPKFAAATARLDDLRRESCVQVFPELAELFLM